MADLASDPPSPALTLECFRFPHIGLMIWKLITKDAGFSGGSDGEESACSAGDLGFLSRLGSSPGVGNGNPLQYSCLESPMDRGTWWATVHGIAREANTT